MSPGALIIIKQSMYTSCTVIWQNGCSPARRQKLKATSRKEEEKNAFIVIMIIIYYYIFQRIEQEQRIGKALNVKVNMKI